MKVLNVRGGRKTEFVDTHQPGDEPASYLPRLIANLPIKTCRKRDLGGLTVFATVFVRCSLQTCVRACPPRIRYAHRQLAGKSVDVCFELMKREPRKPSPDPQMNF